MVRVSYLEIAFTSAPRDTALYFSSLPWMMSSTSVTLSSDMLLANWLEVKPTETQHCHSCQCRTTWGTGAKTYWILTNYVWNSFKKTKIYFHFMYHFSTLSNAEMAQVLKCFLMEDKDMLTQTTPWLLMTWSCKEPGHRQPWHRPRSCRIFGLRYQND